MTHELPQTGTGSWWIVTTSWSKMSQSGSSGYNGIHWENLIVLLMAHAGPPLDVEPQ